MIYPNFFTLFYISEFHIVGRHRIKKFPTFVKMGTYNVTFDFIIIYSRVMTTALLASGSSLVSNAVEMYTLSALIP